MTQGGFAGNERYLAMPVALGCVLAGAGWACARQARSTALAPADNRRWTGPADRRCALVAAAFPFTLPAARRSSTRTTPRLQLPGPAARRPAAGRRPLRRPRARARLRQPSTPAPTTSRWSRGCSTCPARRSSTSRRSPASCSAAGRAPGVNPTPPVNKAWRPVTRAGEFTVLEACDTGGATTMNRLDDLYPYAPMAAVAARLRALPFLSARTTTVAADGGRPRPARARLALPAHAVHRSGVLDRRGPVGRHRPARAARHPGRAAPGRVAAALLHDAARLDERVRVDRAGHPVAVAGLRAAVDPRRLLGRRPRLGPPAPPGSPPSSPRSTRSSPGTGRRPACTG